MKVIDPALGCRRTNVMVDSAVCYTETSHEIQRQGLDERPTKMRSRLPPNAKTRSTEFDLQRIGKTLNSLEASGWYWGSLPGGKAKALLRPKQDGTFLVRDSENSAHLFSLSVKTPRGPTSVRIQYTEDGKFKLDSDKKSDTPEFDCVVKLVDYYMTQTLAGQSKHFWLEPSGRREVPVKLCRPLKGRVPGLQHLCRTVIHRHTSEGEADKLPLPAPLKRFLLDYPYKV